MVPDRRKKQIEQLNIHCGGVFPLSEIKKMFGLAPTTYIGDTWMWQGGHLTKAEFGSWKISKKADYDLEDG